MPNENHNRRRRINFEATFDNFTALYRGIDRTWIDENGVLFAHFVNDQVQEVGPVSGYYYALQAGFTGTVQEWAQLMIDTTVNAQNAAISANDSEYYSGIASECATRAESSEFNSAVSETNAAASEENAEAWSVGTRNNVPVTSEDETYENNAKYYAGRAESIKTNIVAIQDQQPISEDNKIWMMATPPESIVVPSYTEFVNGLDEKAAVIIEDNVLEYSPLSNVRSLKIQGPTTHSVSLFNGKDIIKDVAKKLRTIASDPTLSVLYEEPNTILINGTASADFWMGICSNTSSYDINLASPIPANSVMKFRMYMSGTVTGSLPYCNININGTVRKYTFRVDQATGMASFDFTTTEAVTKIQLQTKVVKDSVCSNVRLSFTCTVDADEIVVPAFNTSDYTISQSLIDSWSYASVIPVNLIVSSVADTKTYIDNHIPDDIVFREDLYFITPEMFGAVGDETTDDTVAITNCFAYAVANKIDVRGKGVYRVSQPISLTADKLNIDLYQLSSWTTFNGYLLTINGSRNNISFDTLQSTHSKGLLVTSIDNKNTANNRFNIGYLRTEGDALTIHTDASNYISYNSFYINKIYTDNGNCITNGNHSTENWFYNIQLEGANGWGVYGTGDGRYYSLCMEQTLGNGIYCKHMDGGTFVSCRHSELINKLNGRLDNTRPNTTGGTLIKFAGGVGSVKYISDEQVTYMAVDVSEAWAIDDSRFDDQTEYSYTPILQRVQSNRGCVQILCPIVHYTYSGANGGITIADGITIIGNKKVCHPFCESKYTITNADFDMRDSLTPNSGKPYPTKFVIGVADCVIHLSSSYCCAGFNRIIVDQSDATKLCTIYDDYHGSTPTTPIFDGQTLGAGVYELRAMYDTDVIDDVYSTHLQVNIPQYTGNNGVWMIKRIDVPSVTQVSGNVYQMNL